MAATYTVISLKESFLRTQVRLLSQPLQPSRNWRDRAPVPEQGELKEKVVQEVLYKLNTIARHHNRAVYSSQALRHVAEQIDALYWASAAPDREARVHGEDVLEKGVDLSTAGNIANLPEEWPDDGGEDESGLERFGESKRYQQLQARLVALNAQRQTQKHKLAQYRQLQRLLEPFKHPQADIQPNLVTKDGELGKELDKMRILIARVSNGMQGLKEGGTMNEEREEESERSTEEKLAGVLGMQ